ncbi:DUF58 domain-containing protein [Microbacterium sp. MEC084]|uniref:DUF58 domain-containing protein n=1 Tax=Microbacterium sp. MEC084 TaxID=1963027 RepID=UPI00106F3D15|nr:DUF58 domain-containing protein [Microbacterium sp. MEC084]MCD1269461.1 DUF58 domain-containing protein [Microbacterium sp. MEC084]
MSGRSSSRARGGAAPRAGAPAPGVRALSRAPLTARGLAAVLLGVGLLVAANTLGRIELVVFGLTLLLLTTAAFVTLRLAGRVTDVERTLSTDVASVGGISQVRAMLVLSARPVPGGRWHDALPPALRAVVTEDEPNGPIGDLPPGGRGVLPVSYAVMGMKRGRHAIGPLETAAIDPFGLARRRASAGGRTPVTIVPAVVPLRALPGAPGATGGAQATTDRHGQGADNLIPRPYAPGDSMRRIHWRASAHHGSFMVREEERETTPRAIVVFDRGARRWSPDAARGDDEGFEAAVTLVVSATWSLVRDGYAVEVMDSDGAPISLVETQDDRRELLVTFASVGPRGEDTLDRLPTGIGNWASAPVILVTGRLTGEDVAGLAPVATQASRAVLLSVDPRGDALERAARQGWHAARLGTDIEAGWLAATRPDDDTPAFGSRAFAADAFDLRPDSGSGGGHGRR